MEGVQLTNNITNILTKPLAQEVFEFHYRTIELMHKGDSLYSN